MLVGATEVALRDYDCESGSGIKAAAIGPANHEGVLWGLVRVAVLESRGDEEGSGRTLCS